jgi:hypothetical protein
MAGKANISLLKINSSVLAVSLIEKLEGLLKKILN